jgi:hypothetical protein
VHYVRPWCQTPLTNIHNYRCLRNVDILSYSQTSINNIPPPDEWTPEWKHHMQNMDMSWHLAYIRCELSSCYLHPTHPFKSMHQKQGLLK